MDFTHCYWRWVVIAQPCPPCSSFKTWRKKADEPYLCLGHTVFIGFVHYDWHPIQGAWQFRTLPTTGLDSCWQIADMLIQKSQVQFLFPSGFFNTSNSNLSIHNTFCQIIPWSDFAFLCLHSLRIFLPGGLTNNPTAMQMVTIIQMSRMCRSLYMIVHIGLLVFISISCEMLALFSIENFATNVCTLLDGLSVSLF